MGHGVCRDCWKFLGEIPFAGSSPVFLCLVFFQVWILSQFYPCFIPTFISILSLCYPCFIPILCLLYPYFFSIFSYCFSVLSLFYPHFIPTSLISLFYLYTAKKMGKRLGNDIRYLTQRKTHSFSGNTTKKVGKRYFLESKKCQKFPKAYKNGISAAGRRILFGVLIFEQCKRR